MLIELTIALGLFSVVIFSTLEVFIVTQEARSIGGDKAKAAFLISEYFESLKNLRRKSWDNLTNGRFLISTSSGVIALEPTATGETVGNYTRYLEITDARRDADGKLVESGGTLDPSTKIVTITISWLGLHPRTITQSAYLTRYMDNLTWTQTTVNDFNANILESHGVKVVPLGDGAVQLGAGGQGDWCEPDLKIKSVDLPGQGITTAISATSKDTNDYAYTTTGGNASGDSMDSVQIDHLDPPNATNSANYNYYKTYGIHVDFKNEYVYLTSDHPGMTVDIVKVSSIPYTQIGTYSSSGGGRADSVDVAYNLKYNHEFGYVTAGNTLRTFDLSDKSGSRPETGRADLTGLGKRVTVVGNYAYVAVSNNQEQLKIFDVTDPYHPAPVLSVNLQNNQPATDLFVNESGNTVYIVTGQTSPNVDNFFIVNIDLINKTSNILGYYSTGDMNPLGITVVPVNIAIIVGSGGNQYQVVRIPEHDPPYLCGYLTNPNGSSSVNAITSVIRGDNTAYSYILTNSAGSEFQMIRGGPGGGISSTGTFESQTKDVGHSTAFNRFFTTVDSNPGVTSIKFQMGVKDPIEGTCTNVTFNDLDFVGPDGTPDSYFSGDGAIPLNNDGVGYENPGQCFRFRAILETTDTLRTPILYDFIVNYSP